MVILNSSGAPQMLVALATCDETIYIVVNQEHMFAGPAFVDLAHDARSAGWSLTGAQAARTENDGFSAGAAIAVKRPIVTGSVIVKSDHSPRASPGRFSATWVQAGPDTRIVVGST